jgi:beta-phosphoglucomutase-like phosphatase (HAD superfamily)
MDKVPVIAGTTMSGISQSQDTPNSLSRPTRNLSGTSAFLFDFDGTLLDSVYQHVLAWHEALLKAGIELSVWRIHRRIGMSGGLLVNALSRETGRRLTNDEAHQLQQWHAEAYLNRLG